MVKPPVFKSVPLRFGIQSRMLLMTFALVSLFVLYVAFNTARQAGRDRERAREQLRLVAAIAGSRLDDQVGDVTQFLNGLGGTLRVEGSDTAANDATLQALSAHMPANVLDVSLWAADGTNIGTSDFVPAGSRPSAADRAFFVAAMRSPGLATEAPVRLAKGGEWTAVFALPLQRKGRTVAVLSATSPLQSLPRMLGLADDLPKEAVVSIVDTEGRFVARSTDAEHWIGRPAPLDRTLLLRRLAEGGGSSEVTGADGVARIFGFARSRSISWLVYVGIPLETALAPARSNTRQSLALGLGMLGFGLFFSAWVAGRIARPLRQLSADARRLGEGDLEHRSQVSTGSEIGQLAYTFNRMAEALQERIVAVRRSEERLSLALEGSDEALFDWDVANDRVYRSAKSAEFLGEPGVATEITPAQRRAQIHPDDLPGVVARIEDTLSGKTPIYEAEYRIRRRDGSWLWVRSRGRVVERDAAGRALRLVGTDADISKRKITEDELRQRAEFDALTALPNRALFNDRIAGAMARSARSGRALALLYLDIDHFKRVNDTHGHEAGDEVLKVVAERLSAAVRTSDTVARIGGDEFTVILEGLAAPADAEAVAGKLVEALHIPVPIGSALIQVSISVGVAMLEPGEDDPASLLRRADEALYDAKRRGRDRYAVGLAAVA